MSCQETREKLCLLDVQDFPRLTHLSECTACRAFAGSVSEAEEQIATHATEFAERVSFDEALRQISDVPTTPRKTMSWTLHTAVVALAAAAAITLAALPILGHKQTQPAELPRVGTEPEDSWMVIVAAGDLPVGHTVTDNDLYAVEIPDGSLYDDAFLMPGAVVGQIVTAPILANEIVSCARLSRCDDAVSGRPKHASRRSADDLPEGLVHQLTASRDLPRGHILEKRDLYAVEIHSDYVPRSGYTNAKSLVGVEVTEPVLANEPLRCERLSAPCPQDEEDAALPSVRPFVGETVLVELGTPAHRVVSDHPEIAEVEILVDNHVAIHGRGAGITRVSFLNADGDPDQAFRVIVEPEASAEPGDDAIRLRVGESEEIEGAPPLAAWRSGDDEIAGVQVRDDGQVWVRARAPGVTTATLVADTPEDGVLLYTVVVEE